MRVTRSRRKGNKGERGRSDRVGVVIRQRGGGKIDRERDKRDRGGEYDAERRV